MDNYTPLSLEAERLLKIASDLNDLYEQQPSAELKEQSDAALNEAIKAYEIAEADLKQRNAGRCILSETEPIEGTVTYDYETGIVKITT